MKFLFSLMAVMALVSCGSDKGSNDSASGEDSKSFAKLVAAGQLPECNEENESQLVYEDTVGFKHCKAGAWLAIDINGKDGVNGAAGKDGVNGVDGSDGLKITETYNVGSEFTDICDRFGNEVCKFMGGSVTFYADGSAAYEGLMSYSIVYDNGGGHQDSDQFYRSTGSNYCMKDAAICYARMGAYARSASDDKKILWLALDKVKKEMKIVYDENDSGEIDAADTKVFDLVLTKLEL